MIDASLSSCQLLSNNKINFTLEFQLTSRNNYIVQHISVQPASSYAPPLTFYTLNHIFPHLIWYAKQIKTKVSTKYVVQLMCTFLSFTVCIP